jgi:hypothetical protein
VTTVRIPLHKWQNCKAVSLMKWHQPHKLTGVWLTHTLQHSSIASLPYLTNVASTPYNKVHYQQLCHHTNGRRDNGDMNRHPFSVVLIVKEHLVLVRDYELRHETCCLCWGTLNNSGQMSVYPANSSQASVALAAGVVLNAFNERANFYSACVHLSQSNLSLMVCLTVLDSDGAHWLTS